MITPNSKRRRFFRDNDVMSTEQMKPTMAHPGIAHFPGKTIIFAFTPVITVKRTVIDSAIPRDIGTPDFKSCLATQ